MLVFLKLGGSLITNKNQPHTPCREALTRLANEISQARQKEPNLQLVIGHGSGSYGHIPAKQYQTRSGVRSPEEWKGFVEVWGEARALNQVVIETLLTAGLPVLAFPPSAMVIAQHGKVLSWDLQPLYRALSAGLIPVVAGDVVFDQSLGGTILSTEELFSYLALQMKPDRILISGIEPGVWEDYPHCTQLIRQITPANFPTIASKLSGSAAVDVTGGMAQKVTTMLELVQKVPHLQVLIFSGAEPDQVFYALLGSSPGTVILSPL